MSALKNLPVEIRARLVVRSMPFGDIIDDETLIVYDAYAGQPPAERYEACVAAKGKDTSEYLQSQDARLPLHLRMPPQYWADAENRRRGMPTGHVRFVNVGRGARPEWVSYEK